MGKISLLDCTLRDGGYVNDWEFGYDNIVNIFERLADSKVDIIEIGFWMNAGCLILIELLFQIQLVWKRYMESCIRVMP